MAPAVGAGAAAGAGDAPPPPFGAIPPHASLRYTERWSEASLRRWRSEGDPPADGAVAELIRAGPLGDIHDLLLAVRRSSGAAAQAFLATANSTPEWVDFRKMERGQRIIVTYLPSMHMSLSLGALVGVGGQFPKMGDVVRATGMLDAADIVGTQQRLQRTGLFVMGLCTPGELMPGKSGHDGILKVRLLHGALRALLRNSPRYKEEHEVPVNQHDLAITLGLFGYVALRSMRRLGVRFSHSDVESYMLLWRYVGYVLGIREELLPRGFRDQQEFFLASTLMMGDACATAGPDIKNAFELSSRMTQTKTRGVVRAAGLRRVFFQLMLHLAGEEGLAGVAAEYGDDPGARNVRGEASRWVTAPARAWGWLTSFVDQRVPLGGRLLYELNFALVRLTHRRAAEHMVRSKL